MGTGDSRLKPDAPSSSDPFCLLPARSDGYGATLPSARRSGGPSLLAGARRPHRFSSVRRRGGLSCCPLRIRRDSSLPRSVGVSSIVLLSSWVPTVLPLLCLSILAMILGRHGVSLAPPERITPGERTLKDDSARWSAMDNEANKPVEHLPDAARGLGPEDFCEV